MSIKSEVQGFDISKNSAVIVGCGGLGTNTAVHLAGADGYDIVIIAVDNIETRREVNTFCKEHKIPCVNGSIDGFFGTAYLYIPDKTPDLETAGCLNNTDKKMHSPSATAGIIGALEAQLATDYFLGKTESAGKLYIYDNNEIHALTIRSDDFD